MRLTCIKNQNQICVRLLERMVKIACLSILAVISCEVRQVACALEIQLLNEKLLKSFVSTVV